MKRIQIRWLANNEYGSKAHTKFLDKDCEDHP
jgi:hypothetical protein